MNFASSAEFGIDSFGSKLMSVFDTLNAEFVSEGVVSIAKEVDLYPDDRCLSFALTWSTFGASGCPMDPELLDAVAVFWWLTPVFSSSGFSGRWQMALSTWV